MKKRKHLALAFGILICFLLFPTSVVSAEEYADSNPDDYITNYFDVYMEFDTAHRATVTETINVTFVQPHHGITRVIPNALDHTYEIEGITVDDEHFSVEKSDSNDTVRIGDADTTLTGEHTYVLHYQIEYFKDADTSADFLAQNMLPTEWETSIRESILTIVMPSEINWDDVYIYGGTYGSDDPEAWRQYFEGYIYEDTNTLELEGSNLPLGYGITLRDVALPEGYWSDAITYVERYRGRLTAITVISVVLALLAALLWVLYGRDEKIIETVEFYPPEGMTPGELGYAIDGVLDDKEMMTTVLYLADKGYISIKPDDKEFIFEKQKNADENEPRHIKTFLDGMFSGRKHFKTKKVPSGFRSDFDDAKAELEEDYSEKFGDVTTFGSTLARLACLILNAINFAAFPMILDWEFDGIYLAVFPVVISSAAMIFAWVGTLSFKINTKKILFRIVAAALAIATQVILVLWLYDAYPKGLYYYAFMASGFVIFFFSLIMEKRTPENAKLMGKAFGFANFIRDAEYDRLVTLSEADPQYYYHILPYAAVLGMETAWSKRFENIKIPNPDWFVSDDAFVYTPLWCDRMVSSCTRGAVPPAPSSGGSSGGFSGGSSGGGFSGGGGGGGGGGAW
ncbi:MAG: DUF2207 domain-containing protein [Lachnospiraceae bacterium]|nr:DUF2207 domain-containing protein [Lachnospiraceae bacterium]